MPLPPPAPLPALADALATSRKYGAMLLDLDRRITWCNAHMLDTFGYRSEEMYGLQPRELMPDTEDTRRLLEQLNRELPGGHSVLRDMRFVHRSGRHLWMDVETRATFAAGGGVDGFLAIATDVTERKRFEHGWRFAEQEMVAAGLARLHCAADGRVVEVNTAATRLLGYPEHVLVGMDPAQLHPTLPDGFLAEAQAHVQRHGSVRFEAPALHADGRLIDVEVELFVLKVGDNARTSVFMRDVSERLALQRAVARQREQVDGVFEHAHDLIATCDPTGVIRNANPAWSSELGYPPDAVVGRRISEFLHADDIAATWQAMARVNQGEVVQVEARMLRADGAEVLIEWLAFGSHDQVRGIGRNVTERRRHERELEHARKRAEAAAAAKSMFLAMMSHEIRTPMNGVLGMASLLLDTALDDGQRDMLRVIHDSGTALLGVINDVLDYSRLEVAQLSLDPLPFRIADVCADVCTLLGPQADGRALRLRQQIAPDVPAFLLGDGGRIRQILLNLVGDALKFTERGGVLLAVNWFDGQADAAKASDARAAAPQLHIHVCDTGIGMTEAQSQAIFAPFSQADASTSRRFGGTGLGLAIVKQLVTLMGGRVGVHSAAGAGSTFWVQLPLQRAEPPAAAAPSLPDAQLDPLLDSQLGAGWRVLVAEDNSINQVVLRRMLERLGCSVDVASDGLEAVDMYERERHPIVLMDWHMPRLDGLDATRRIRALEPSAPVHVVAITASAQPEDAAACFAAGMNDYVVKPLRLEIVAAALRRAISALGAAAPSA
jgi:PAS domain S-box-containing protein